MPEPFGVDPPDAGPRRIARIITRLNIGGPSIQAVELSRSLEDGDFRTCLIHGRLSSGEGDMTALLPMTDIQSVYLPDLRRTVSPLHDVRGLWRMYRALCRWRPDIVHTHTAKAGTLGRLAAMAYNRTVGRNRPARLIHTYHGHVFEGYFGSLTSRLFLAIERWLGKRTDALVAISQQIKQDLLHEYRIARDEQVQVVPLGFNLDRFAAISQEDRLQARASLGIPSGITVVTTVGRLTPIKCHSLFLEMAARLVAQSGDWLFLVVGDGEGRRALESQAAAASLTPHVRFCGWRADLDRIYAATDIFVLTSRNEGTPVALIEAMASGVASVSTDVGGVRDVITEPALGQLVPFGDADALAAAVVRFAGAPHLRDLVGRAARDAVLRRFQLARLIADVTQLYRELLGDAGG